MAKLPLPIGGPEMDEDRLLTLQKRSQNHLWPESRERAGCEWHWGPEQARGEPLWSLEGPEIALGALALAPGHLLSISLLGRAAWKGPWMGLACAGKGFMQPRLLITPPKGSRRFWSCPGSQGQQGGREPGRAVMSCPDQVPLPAAQSRLASSGPPWRRPYPEALLSLRLAWGRPRIPGLGREPWGGWWDPELRGTEAGH